MPTKIFFILLFMFASAFCGKAAIFEYRNGQTEKIKKTAFSKKAYFRAKGRSVEINQKKLDRIDVFSDTIEIYYGETWVKTYIYPKTKDTVNIPVHVGWMKINTVLTGVAEFGKVSASITELRRIKFKIPEYDSEDVSQWQGQPRTTAFSPAAANADADADAQVPDENTETAEGSGETANEDENQDEQNEQNEQGEQNAP